MSDDQTNPFVMAGMMGMMQPNKYTDPAFRNKPLGLQGYTGAPTDALGNPIQSFTDAQTAHDQWAAANPAPAQGTTLNSTPKTGNPNPVGTPLNPTGDWSVLAPDLGMGPQVQANYAYDLGLPGSAYNGHSTTMDPQGTAGGQRTAAPAQTNPVDMRQAYLDALSNPGKVTTPGATVPQAQPLGTPSVMSSFLAAHPSGGQGAGNYNNQPFFDTLNKLRST